MAARIEMPMDEIAEFCRRRGIVEFAIFGSVLRDDFGPESDVDVLVRYAPDAKISLLDEVEMEWELADLFGRKVDLVGRAAIEASRNPIRRETILRSAEVIYAA